MMNEPKIKLRDGWGWLGDIDGSWLAFYEGDHDVEVFWSPKTGCLVSDAAPPDVVLAVIQANAPEVLREFVAGLATPRDRTRPPPHYGDVFEWLLTNGVGDDQDKRDACYNHRDDVAADCYPELVARIAELEREVASYRALGPVAISGDGTVIGRDGVERTALEWANSAPVEPPVEWVDGRATVGGFVLVHSPPEAPSRDHTVWALAGPGHIDIVHKDEDTAKRGAIAVARAMGGGDV